MRVSLQNIMTASMHFEYDCLVVEGQLFVATKIAKCSNRH